MFWIGQKVVCVDDRGLAAALHQDEVGPLVGDIYTVRGLICVNGQHGVKLFEIVNPPHQYWGETRECAFYARRFRPVVEKKTDISVFEEILQRAPVGSRLPANVT
jgi:hypothetical protein